MNKIIQIFLAAVLFVFSSCQKESIIRFGFDCDFGKDSQGLTIIKVGSSANTIILTGEITLAEGGVFMQLLNPEEEIVFSRERFMPGNLRVNQSFQATAGIWKLKYQSFEGKGSINLHLNIENN